jgi:hypothetical protein
MDKKSVVPVITIITLVCLLSSVAFSQAPVPKTPSAMVYIPVSVNGPKNLPVNGLKKENFVLLEDNIEQTVTAFYDQNSRVDIDIILALNALQKGRADQNSIKIREAIANFRFQGNSQNRYNIEEMPFGANGIYDAISRHITRLVENSISPRKIVLAITDGFESSGGEPVKALQEYARRFDVSVYIIFSPGGDNDLSDNILAVGRGQRIFLSGGAGYEDLTQYTGGKLIQAEVDTQVQPTLEVFSKTLKNQYLLGFRSTNDARDDKWRNIEIKLKAPQGVGGVPEKEMKPEARNRYFVSKPR